MSNENQHNDDEKKNNEKDPYNFFKLVSDSDDNNDDGKKPKKPGKFPFLTLTIAVVLVLAFVNMFLMQHPEDNMVDFSTFRTLIQNGKIVRVELGENLFIGYGPAGEKPVVSEEVSPKTLPWLKSQNPYADRYVYKTTGFLMSKFIEFLDENKVEYKFVTRQTNVLFQIFLNILPFLIIIGIYFFMFRKMTGGLGGIGSIFGNGGGKSKAVDEGKVNTRFDDVAGVDEAKEELVEVVDFLKEPKKYTEIGGKIPKGVLLVGPPGTGKTLLARAVAGEAGVPFFRISGSDFVEMFVGVGASRVRDLFRQAREKAPCIIFIDELDAIGKSRVNNLGGNDEREQTLNQLLVEMDGFDNEKGLIILAATNRPDILDPALLRPGRFDRQVAVDRPDVKGREAILRIHAKNVKIDNDVDFVAIAKITVGYAGADLANLVNEAALLAVRAGRKLVSMVDFNEANEKVTIGLKRKSKVVSEKKRRLTAVHETGHALVAAFTPDSDPVHKITIIPRGSGVGGFTMHLPDEDEIHGTERMMYAEVDSLLGGRAAEQIILGEISTGASSDIQRATDIIHDMITVYGMSKKFRNMTLGKRGGGYSGEPSLVREYSETTQQYIDEEIARIMEERYEHVLSLLGEKKELLEFIAERLLEIETMEGKEFYDIVNNAKRCEKIQIEAKTEMTAPENPSVSGAEAQSGSSDEKSGSGEGIV